MAMIPRHEVVVEFRLSTRLHPSELTGIVERGLRSLGVLDPVSDFGSRLVGPVLASIELAEDPIAPPGG